MEKSSKSWLHAVQKIDPQTNKHLLSNCESLLERYSERHNKILEKIARWIDSNKSSDQCLAVDLPFPAFHNTDSVFKQSIRPDIILYDNSSIAVLELTVCHETNLNKSREYKLSKYEEGNKHLQSHFSHTPVQVFTVEISVLGIASDFTLFCDATNLPRLPKETIAQLVQRRHWMLTAHLIYTNWEIILFSQIRPVLSKELFNPLLCRH